MKKKPVRIGVVGAGAIGINAALEHLSLPDVQDRVTLAAVCDPFPGRAKAAAGKYNVAADYERYEDLLADPGVDAVTICSPIGFHYQQGMMAIKAGKHVHFNKTMTLSVKEADRLIEAAKKKKVRIVASPGMMIHPRNQRARRAVLEGKIGKLVWAATGVAMGDYHLEEKCRTGKGVLSNIDPSWYFKQPGGGPLWDVVVYNLHNMTGMLGPAKSVIAMSGLVRKERHYRGRKIKCEVDDNTFMLLEFGNSAFGLVYAAADGQITPGFTANIYGTSGSIVEEKLNGKELKRASDHQPHVKGQHAKMIESHVFEDIMQLVDFVREGKPSLASAEHARHVIDIFESGYRSARTGKREQLRSTFKPMTISSLT